MNGFTRLVFGLTQRPFILETILKISAISDDMYLDVLTSEGKTVGEIENLK